MFGKNATGKNNHRRFKVWIINTGVPDTRTSQPTATSIDQPLQTILEKSGQENRVFEHRAASIYAPFLLQTGKTTRRRSCQAHRCPPCVCNCDLPTTISQIKTALLTELRLLKSNDCSVLKAYHQAVIHHVSKKEPTGTNFNSLWLKELAEV